MSESNELTIRQSKLKKVVLMTVDGIRNRRWATSLVLLMLVVSISLVGVFACAPRQHPQGVKTETRLNQIRMLRFLELVKEGKVTDVQKIAMLKANYKAWVFMDVIVNPDQYPDGTSGGSKETGTYFVIKDGKPVFDKEGN